MDAKQTQALRRFAGQMRRQAACLLDVHTARLIGQGLPGDSSRRG
jgi:hypothetical protein